MWLYSTVWLWYLAYHGTQPTWTPRPWYAAKRRPSFADALAALRRSLWTSRLFPGTDSRPLTAKTPAFLVEMLAEAA